MVPTALKLPEPVRSISDCSAETIGACAPWLLGLAWLLLTASPLVAAGKQQLMVQPSALKLTGQDPQHGLLVTLVEADGRQRDVTSQARFKSRSPALFDVDAEGQCKAKVAGSGAVEVSFSGLSAQVAVAVEGQIGKASPSFQEDVVPLLTRAGCNMGACHGKLAGQNGFKLSLRGFAPEEDFDRLAREGRGRRVNFAQPDDSLLLQKAMGRVPHEGGARFAPDSRAHQLLRDWMHAAAPGPKQDEPRLSRLEILPGNRLLRPGDQQRLLVRAHYPDGRVRDVTWLAQIFSNDESIVTVTPEGVATARREGEASVRVHFQDQVAVILFSIPFTNRVPAEQFTARNNAVDDAVFKKLAELRIPPAGLCDDATFCRRVHLDLTGALPSADVAAKFARDADPAKRDRLIEELLRSPRFTDYWTLQLADLLQNRKERDHDVRGAKGVRAFHGWLREQIAANRPWDHIARAVLTAKGTTGEAPPVGYYVYVVGEKRQTEQSEVVDSVAQAFLGTRIGCARCHNHPLERYTQDDFYHFAAFFSRLSLNRVSPEDGYTRLDVATNAEQELLKQIKQAEERVAKAKGEATQAGLEAKEAEKRGRELKNQEKRVDELQQQLAKARSRPAQVMQPRTRQMMAARPLDRRELNAPAATDPREVLADWMTAPTNDYFSGAMVNRVWKHFLGVGLVEPVDDLRDSNPPSNPELWALLKREFVRGGFDLRQLMRLIVSSRAYQLDSQTQPGNAQDQRFYSHYYARRLPAEVFLDALGDATGVPESFPGYPVGLRAVQLPEPTVNSYFLGLFGRSERITACACERDGEVTLPQLLHLSNGEEITSKIKAASGTLAELLKDSDDRRVLEELYLRAFSRLPTAAERESVSRLRSAGETREAFFADLFWALLNTKEFAFNH